MHANLDAECDDRSSEEDCAPSECNSSDDESNQSSQGPETCRVARMFTCPEQSCTKTFIRYSALERHCEFGAHARSLEKITLQDRAKIYYAKNLQEGQTRKQQSLQVSGAVSTLHSSEKCPMGWALKSSTRKVRFTERQKEFLDLQYNKGEQSGNKSSGEEVAKQMRRARGQDGTRLFAVDEFLTPQQISSYFSRMAAKRKNVSEADEETEDREKLVQEVTAEITDRLATTTEAARKSALTLEKCCYTYKRYKLCCMGRDDLHAKLTLSNLKSICLKYGIRDVSGRKKDAYVNAVISLMKSTPCTFHKDQLS